MLEAVIQDSDIRRTLSREPGNVLEPVRANHNRQLTTTGQQQGFIASPGRIIIRLHQIGMARRPCPISSADQGRTPALRFQMASQSQHQRRLAGTTNREVADHQAGQERSLAAAMRIKLMA